MKPDYDVAIVGSRLAGGTLAMQLAKQGLKVVAVDKSTFPSNKVPCTHTIPAGAEATLRRLGLYDDFIAAGADPVRGVHFIYPEGRTFGEIRTNGVPTPGLQLRRYITDNIVVQHARKAGAEIKESFMVRDLLRDGTRVVGFRGENGSGKSEEIRARLVVAADGRRSSFGSESPFTKHWPCYRFYYYQYFEPTKPIEPIILCWDENPDIVCVGPIGEGKFLAMVAPHMSKFDEFVSDLENNFNQWIRSRKELREIIDSSTPISRIWGRGNLDNTYRDPICEGLVLLGDAGLDVDPLAAQGTAWALMSAEILADVLQHCFKTNDLSREALSDFTIRRDETLLENFKFFSLWSLTKKRNEEEQQFALRCIRDSNLSSDLAGMWHLTVKPSAVFGTERFQGPIADWQTETPLNYGIASTA
jgi:flavin-dependent dehydrogenase